MVLVPTSEENSVGTCNEEPSVICPSSNETSTTLRRMPVAPDITARNYPTANSGPTQWPANDARLERIQGFFASHIGSKHLGNGD